MTNTRLQNVTRKALFLLMMVLLGSTSLLRADELTVYDGTSTNSYVPIYGYYADCYVKSEYVIPADDLVDMDGGTIDYMKFYLSSPSAAALTGTFQVYLAEVADATISAFYDGEVTVVYEGTVNTTESIMTIEFTESYEYNGGNLLVGFVETSSGNYKSCTFYGETVSDASVQGYSCSGPSSISPTQRNFIPKTTFIYEAGSGVTKYQVSAVVNPEGAGVVTGTGKYYEDSQCTLTATPSSEAYYFVNWTNEDGEVVSTNAAYTFTVTRDVTYVANFEMNQQFEVEVYSALDTIGIVTGEGVYYEDELCTVFAAGDGNYLFDNWTINGEIVSTNPTYTFEVTENVSLVANFVPFESTTLYDGTVTNYGVPVWIQLAYEYTQSQCVMPAEDLTALVGKSIKGLRFYVTEYDPYFLYSNFMVYMTEYPDEAITSFMEPATATTVYYGMLSMVNNEMTITFDTPYDYFGGNLLIGINTVEPQGTTPYYTQFYGVDKRDASVYYAHTENVNFSYYYPNQGNFLPKTQFFFDNDVAPLYNVTASVNPEGAGYVYGEGQYSEGGTCILEAYANPGYTFQNWTVGGEVVSTYAAYEFTVESNVDAVANFVPSLVMTPNQAEMGYRPNNAWMRSYPVTISNNDYMSVTVNSITTDNEYFQINTDIEFPVVVRYQESLDLEIMHSTGDGAVIGNLIVNFGDDQTLMFDMSAIAYEPGEADVWETAVEVNEYPYQGTATGLYHNYMIPEAAEDANDAVYKITVDQLSTLEVTTGNVESVFAVYPEDFDGIGGPDLENTYSYGMPVVVNNWFTEGFEGGLNDWWTIDVNADGGTWIHSDENHGGYDYTALAHDGTGFAMCYSYIDYQGAYNTDSYMVTPNMYSIEAGSTLTFWADNANDSYPEYFTVCVSTAENPTADDFIEIWSGSAKGRSNSQAKVRHTENTRYDNWRFHAIDLSEFAGQNVWIAFHDVNYDMYEIWIDDVELSGNRGREVAEDGFVVEPGTYYVVVAAAANQFPVNINLGAAPAPVAAQMVYPTNDAINIAAPCSFVWSLGAYTEEMQVLFGLDYPPTEVLIDWTDELVNSIGIEELEDNTIYYIQVNERNATGTTEGDIVTFTSHLTVPELMTDNPWYSYEGDNIRVYWNAIDDAALLSYNVYINNELVVNTTELEYIIENVEYNLSTGYDVTVTAVYTYGESEQSNDLFFFVSGNGSVAGYVYEQDGVTPIAGATVLFEGEDVFGLTVSGHFTTNDEGAFEGTLPYGWYDGYANKDGYQQATCSQFIVYYNQTTDGVHFMMKEEYNPVASVTVTPGDDAATVEWSFNDRSFQFNRVYFAEAYSNEKVLLADSLYNTTTYVDSTWAELPMGSYRYGVASVYEGNAGGNRDIEEVIIGEATWTNSYVPTYNLYNYSCTNQIYTAEEIGDAGTIYSLSFMPNSVTEGAKSRNLDIYMVNTDKTSFESGTDWVPVTDADLVFSGTAYWTANEWSTITLDTPFNYDGTNLCVVVNDLTGSWTSSNSYHVFDATAQALRIYQDSAPYNPAAPGNGTVLNVKNYIKLGIESSSLAGHESPIVWSDLVDKDMYTTLSFTVTVNNGESTAGAEIAFTNYNEVEQELFPVEPVVLDETGLYTWDSFRKGDYYVTITKEGFETLECNCSIYEPSVFTFTLLESTTTVEGIYVSPTGWAMWADAVPAPEHEEVYWMESFENGIPEGWTMIDADGDGYNWKLSSTWISGTVPAFDGADMICSQSYDDNAGALYPDNYLVTPLQYITNGTTFSFWAAAQDANWAAEHFGVCVSVDGLSFNTLAEWTMTAKGGGAPTNNTKDGSRSMGNWYLYSVDLSDYANQSVYIAIRHFGCTDMYYLDVDNIEFSAPAFRGRQYESYHIMLVDAEGNVLLDEDTLEEQMQLPVEDLVEGQLYLFRVANKYTSGLTDYTEYYWTYVPCEEYAGAESVVYTVMDGGNMVTWDNPVGGGQIEILLYDTYGDGWNGGYLTVTFGNGDVETLTLDDGWSTSFAYDLNSQHITMVYTPGSWSGENYFEVKTDDGEVLAYAEPNTMYSGMTFEFDVVNKAKTLFVRDGESLGFIDDNYYFDEGDTDEHEYVIRIVYPDYAMACEQVAEYKELFQITATANAGGLVNGDVMYSEIMFEGTDCTLEAMPYEGYVFKNWTKDGEAVSTDAIYTFVVEEDADYVANFIDMSNFYIVDPNAYESNMTLTGIVKIDGVEQDNRFLEVSAWSGDEVRGAAFLEHVDITIGENTIDRYFVLMTVYGNEGDELTFKLYDHNTAEELDIMCTSNLTFEADENYGSLIEPYEINFMNVIAVDYQFTPGWNWWSTHVELTAIDGLAMLEEGVGTEATQISAQTSFTNYYAGYGWYGSLNAINNEEMYRVQMSGTADFTMIGPKANPADHPITLTKGWNHIGYIAAAEMSVNDALVNVTPQQGDMVKSQKSYANYYEGYGWYGSLNTVKPGDGLMYKSVNDDPITFTYPVATGTRELAENLTGDNNHWVPNVYGYRSNMTVMAVIEMEGVELASDNYELAAFVNGECRGSIQLVYAEPLSRYVAFLTVSGEEAANLSFGLYNTETGEEFFNTTSTLTFNADAVVGNPAELFVIGFRSGNSLNGADNALSLYPNPISKGGKVNLVMSADAQPVRVEIMDAMGRIIAVEPSMTAPASINVPETAGVYTVRVITENNGVMIQKLVVR